MAAVPCAGEELKPPLLVIGDIIVYTVAHATGGITMTKTLSLKEARARFSSLVEKADRLSERYVVTKNGTPAAVVMGAEEFEGWVETLEVLSNPKALKSLRRGLKEAKAGTFKSFKHVFNEEQ